MFSRNIVSCLILVLIPFLTGCQNPDPVNSENVIAEVTELNSYRDLISSDNLSVGLPVGLKYDDHSQHLFIHDLGGQIIEMDDSNNVVNVYGGRGNGPGETGSIDNFFITDEHLFIIDGGRYFINKYSRSDGRHISSLDYGALLEDQIRPLLPITDINNRPFVTLNETILLPTQTGGEFLYELFNWEGEKLADLGEIPDGYMATEDSETIMTALENKNVPSRDLSLAFPVNDRSNPDEIFIVYSAIPKISKYTLSGRKLWEHSISPTPEVDSLMTDLSNLSMTRQSPMTVRKYITGRSNQNGDLYLGTYTNFHIPPYRRPVWIHRFDSGGSLVNRYQIISDIDLVPFAGFDLQRQRIFVALANDIGIRAYPF